MSKKNAVKLSVMLIVLVAILTLDLVTKYVFDAQLSGGESISVIPYLFNFKLVHNDGAAWGIFSDSKWFLIALSVIFLAFFMFYYTKEKNKSWLFTIAFAFLMAGCIGNLFDRVVFGYVRDFIQFDFWQSFPIFNFADTALCIGVVLFVVYLIVCLIKSQKEKGVKNGN